MITKSCALFWCRTLREASVEAAATGACETALALADKEKFDAYIVDSLLDDIDGLSLVAQLRATKNGAKMPIFVDVESGHRAGAAHGPKRWLRRVFGQTVRAGPIRRASARAGKNPAVGALGRVRKEPERSLPSENVTR